MVSVNTDYIYIKYNRLNLVTQIYRYGCRYLFQSESGVKCSRISNEEFRVFFTM